MQQARKIVLAKHFDGAPTPANFKIVKETLKEVQDGEILCKAEWLTVDPYMRFMANGLKVGEQMMGAQVAKVLRSRHPDFPEGSQVIGNFGWRDLTIAKVPPKGERGVTTLHAMPEMKGLPDSYALGALGMPGVTAFRALTDITQPKKGETLVISGAAGAVGSLVGQIGKIYGCNVIGYAGSDDKVEWLKTLGFDQAYNYKTRELCKTLKIGAPKGVDCYFDNVGGDFSYTVMKELNSFGRVTVCGNMSAYNNDPNKTPTVPLDILNLMFKNIKMEGFIVFRWQFEQKWFDAINQMRDWALEGKLKVEETRVNGFENMPQAFIDLLAGKGTGKVVVQA